MLAAPAPAAPPVMPPVTNGAGQLYVVPAGITPLVMLTGVTEKGVPLQADAVMLIIVAAGRTVTINVKLAPVHVPIVGVTV